LLSPAEGGEWVSRRDERTRLPLEEIGRVGSDGVPYLRPEIVLLFKAKHCRTKDNLDFDSVLSKLDAGAVRWLHEALALLDPDHQWLERLPAD
jgi:hypothetical protein